MSKVTGMYFLGSTNLGYNTSREGILKPCLMKHLRLSPVNWLIWNKPALCWINQRRSPHNAHQLDLCRTWSQLSLMSRISSNDNLTRSRRTQFLEPGAWDSLKTWYFTESKNKNSNSKSRTRHEPQAPNWQPTTIAIHLTQLTSWLKNL